MIRPATSIPVSENDSTTMLTMLANHTRPILNPSADYSARSARQQNLSTGATVALVVGAVILVPIIMWGVVATTVINKVSNAELFKNFRGRIGDHSFVVHEAGAQKFEWTVSKNDVIVASGVEKTSQLATTAVQRSIAELENNDDTWRDDINIEAAMPTLADFPMGWKSEMFPGSSQDYGDNPYQVDYLVLELNSPSNKCSPMPCKFVAVYSAASPGGSNVGWTPTQTQQQALNKISDVIRTFDS